MNAISKGFLGRRRTTGVTLPPGQYLTEDFPVLSAGPTPRIPLDTWQLSVRAETADERAWSWTEFQALPSADVTVDLHCVTRWSKLGTTWTGVSLDTLLEGITTEARFAVVESYGGYTTNLPLADIVGGKAWVAFKYDGDDLHPAHGGPARLLVPHLYLWKSAKWVRSITLTEFDRLGFWESAGYHAYGDPWREQRYAGQ